MVSLKLRFSAFYFPAFPAKAGTFPEIKDPRLRGGNRLENPSAFIRVHLWFLFFSAYSVALRTLR